MTAPAERDRAGHWLFERQDEGIASGVRLTSSAAPSRAVKGQSLLRLSPALGRGDAALRSGDKHSREAVLEVIAKP